MAFEQHLFISFAHIDNKPLTADEKGWITRFHGALDSFLSMRLGGHARIWRSNKLQGNDVLSEEIIDQFPKTAVLVSVLSPRYLKSEWCAREIRAFVDAAEQTGGIVIDNKARIFKVIKAPIKTQDVLPPVVQDTLGYEFFTYEDGAPLELDPKEDSGDYRRKVSKLAWDISQLLEDLDAGGQEDQKSFEDQSSDDDKPVVFLAECSFDRKQDREIIDGMLQHHGYKVLPDRPMPGEEPEYVEVVKEMLSRSQLAVHLLGTSYGGVPDGPTMKSETMLQNEIAAELSKNDGLNRIIWLPEGTHSEQEQQQNFIDSVHQDSKVQFGADLITRELESLKSSVLAMLKKLEEPEPEPPEEVDVESTGSKLIYLICNEKDRKATVPIRKFFRNEGIDVAIPAFEGDAKTVRQAHRQQMTDCDAVLLFYGQGDEGWKRTLDSELKKMPGYRGGKPLLAGYTYLADPKTADKEDLIDMEEPNLINGLGEFSESNMAEMMEAMNVSGVTS